jgi:signal transduction histidine kinase
MGLGLFILYTVCSANIILGLVVLLKNPRKNLNRAFFYFVCAVSFWTIFNFLTDNVTSLSFSLWSARLANFSALLGVYCFWYFCSLYTSSLSRQKNLLISLVLPFALLLSLTPLAIKDVTSIATAANQEVGPLYWLVVVILVFGFAGLALELINGMNNAKDPLKKTHIKLILTGTTLTFVLSVSTNILLPLLGVPWSVSRFGPIFTFILVAFVAVGIIKHQLFDIRPIIARSVAYLLTLAVIIGTYTLVVFNLADHLFHGSSLSPAQQTFYVFSAIASGLMFAPIKSWFDKITNKIFYRDAYDPQALLDNLNSALVTNLDLNDLAKSSARIISSHIGLEYAIFLIKSADVDQSLMVGTRKAEFVNNDQLHIVKELNDAKVKVLLTSDLVGGSNLSAILNKYSIGAVASLVSHKELVGYLLLGEKKSGSTYSQQDVGIVSIIAEELAIAVQNSLRFEEIKQFNATLQQKIKEATAKLSEANARLRALDDAKDEFVSMASHQLRTPLTTIKGYLSMVLEGSAGPVTKSEREMIQQAFDSAERMVYLIGDLLNVSRLQSGKFQIENQPTNLKKAVENEMGRLQEAAASHDLKLSFAGPADFPILMLDDMKIRQVIMNFIDNAIYYTPAGGEVSIQLTTDDKQVAFVVTDTGLGVPKSEQHKLFAKFYRAENARKIRPDGTGLGLYMAKKIIVAQGGAIIFKSTEGQGSTFGFSFPRKAVEQKNTQ